MTMMNGGPAFPVYTPDMNVADDAGPGMSLRDWFAGQALPYLTEFLVLELYNDRGPSDIAAKAYQIADAMLAQRAKATS